jgi:hypothetical protein
MNINVGPCDRDHDRRGPLSSKELQLTVMNVRATAPQHLLENSCTTRIRDANEHQ